MTHTAEHAIQGWLRAFEATWYPPGTEPSRMRPETVRYVKRSGGMWFITCDADGRRPERWRWTIETSRDEQGRWSAHGISGSVGSGQPLNRGRPWANLGGHWGPKGFRAGGTVEDAAGIARVRLTDRQGQTFEDAVEHGVVLFSSDEPVAMPMRLELIDASSKIVHSEEWGFVDE